MSRPEETEFDPDRVVIRDKRRLDPETGAVRAAAAGGGADAAPQSGEPVGSPPDGPQPGDPVGSPPDGPVGDQEPPDRAAELTADLQRVSAEYANYRKRVDRDRVAVVEMATAGLLAELLPVLDDVDRAREHGDLTGAFQAVGERLEAVVERAGLERFGAVGEAFDPAVHEALLQAAPDPSATVATCAMVLQPGYRLRGGRVLRAARVSVAEPGAVAPDLAPEGAAPDGPGPDRA